MALVATGQHTLHSYEAPQLVFDNKAYTMSRPYSYDRAARAGVDPVYVMTESICHGQRSQYLSTSRYCVS